MSFSKSTFCVLILMCMSTSIKGSYIEELNQNPPPHQPGYRYNKEFNLFYKVHELPSTWYMARDICEAEGAVLMWFKDEVEAQAVLQIFPKSRRNMFLGIHSKFSDSYYVTLSGIHVDKLYTEWESGQPDNSGLHVDCVSMSQEGMSVVDCTTRLPFICRRDYDGNVDYLTNDCKTHDKGYIYKQKSNRCYKVHKEQRNWYDAYAICSAEGSYLAVVNSPEEIETLNQLTNDLYVYGTYWLSKIPFLIGFHDMFSEGQFRTIFGETLSEAGFDTFGADQRNFSRDVHCGSLVDGQLSEFWCTRPAFFICERELPN